MRIVPSLLALSLAACATGNPRQLAVVNGEVIAGKDLRAEFARRHVGLDKTIGDREDVRKYLGRLVDRRLFVQEGYRVGLGDDPGVREAVERYRRDRLAEAFAREHIDGPARPTDAEVRAVYDAFNERLRIRQIVVPTQAEIEAIRAELAAGADVEAVARTRSKVASAMRGGMTVIGWGGEEAREAACGKLQPGELSQPYHTHEGWEICRLEARLPVEKPDFDDVADRIRSILEQRKRTALEGRLFPELWARHQAQVLPCLADVAGIKAALASRDQAACATWQGGALTRLEVAESVKLKELEARPAATWPELQKPLVEDLVNRYLLAREAEAAGLGARADVVDAVKARQDDLVERKLYTDYVVKGIEASEPEARAWFDAHPEAFRRPASWAIAQIAVETAEKAAEVKAKLDAGEPFEDLAKAYSEDKRNADKGGFVGVVGPQDLAGPFEPVMALQVGEVSAPLRSKQAWHIVKVLQHEPDAAIPWEQAKLRAHDQALEEKRGAARDRWVAQLRAAASVKVSEAGLAAFEQESLEAIKKDNAEKLAEGVAKAEKQKAREARDAARRAAAEAKAKAAADQAPGAADGGPAAPPPAPAPARP